MNNEELINLSQAVTHGKQRLVKHLATEKRGTVLTVRGNDLTVDTGQGAPEIWPYRECVEPTH